MKRLLFLLIVTSLVSCNATPEVALNESLPTASTPVSETSSPVPSAEEVKTPETPSTEANSNSNVPSPEATASSEAKTSPEPELKELKSGTFINAAHKVSGQAKIIQTGGELYLRLEDFESENGPGLHMYLVKNDTGSPKGDDFIDLGSLKSTKGNQNYLIPKGTDVTQYMSTSVWCQPFGVNFGFAILK